MTKKTKGKMLGKNLEVKSLLVLVVLFIGLIGVEADCSGEGKSCQFSRIACELNCLANNQDFFYYPDSSDCDPDGCCVCWGSVGTTTTTTICDSDFDCLGGLYPCCDTSYPGGACVECTATCGCPDPNEECSPFTNVCIPTSVTTTTIDEGCEYDFQCSDPTPCCFANECVECHSTCGCGDFGASCQELSHTCIGGPTTTTSPPNDCTVAGGICMQLPSNCYTYCVDVVGTSVSSFEESTQCSQQGTYDYKCCICTSGTTTTTIQSGCPNWQQYKTCPDCLSAASGCKWCEGGWWGSGCGDTCSWLTCPFGTCYTGNTCPWPSPTTTTTSPGPTTTTSPGPAYHWEFVRYCPNGCCGDRCCEVTTTTTYPYPTTTTTYPYPTTTTTYPYPTTTTTYPYPTTTTSTTTTTTLPQPTCTETDGGKDYYTFGTVTVVQGPYEWEYDDFCLDANNLTEYWCEGSVAASENYTCPAGCLNGACVIPIECTLDSVAIIPECDSGDPERCEEGEHILVEAFYAPSCPIPAYIQVDAYSDDLSCVIQHLRGNMQGINVTCDASPCTGHWEIPPIPPECECKELKAKFAALWEGGVVTGNWTAGREPSGSFDLFCPGATTTTTTTPETTTTTTLPIKCTLDSVSIIPECDAGVTTACEEGEKILVEAFYSGDCPPSVYLQVDAWNADETCVIEHLRGSMQGINVTCDSSPCTKYWELPSIPAECECQQLNATQAAIWDGELAPGNWIDAQAPSGSFNLMCPEECGYIEILKFHDTNANEVQDAGEVGVPGFTFNINGQGLDFNESTGNDGLVTTECLSVGDYEVTEYLLPGWEATTPQEQNVSVASGQTVHIEFGNKQVPAPTTTTTPETTTTSTSTTLTTTTTIISTCNDYCISLTYASGTCRENPTQCTVNSEIHEGGGDVYCIGGPQADTCCCELPITTTTTLAGEFNAENFRCVSVGTGENPIYDCIIDCSNNIGETVKIMFLYKEAGTGKVVEHPIPLIGQGQSISVASQFVCGERSGDFKVSWKAYLWPDNTYENPIKWSLSTEEQTITC